MKPSLLALSFLLFAFPLAFSDGLPSPVLDINGNPVLSGTEYIFVIDRPEGQLNPGLLWLGTTGNSTSPATVEAFFGPIIRLPVKFIPAGATTSEIFTYTPLEIEFPKNYTAGVESPKWIVVVDNDIGQTYVGIGGPEDHPGQQTYSGTFSILKCTDGSHSLAFSLPIMVEGLPVSWNLALNFIRQALSLLVLTNNGPGFHFHLIKADEYPGPGIRTVV